MPARPLVVLRPEPGNAATVAAARALGIEAHAAPLFAMAPTPWESPGAAGFDALLAGSANTFRLGGATLESLRGLPVWAVGAATAEAAQAAGLAVARVGEGGLQALLDGASAGQRLLRLAGAERTVLVPPAGVGIETRVVYRAEPLPLTPAAADILERGAVAALHSGKAAERLAAECARLGMAREAIALACLAPRIADSAGSGWGELSTAAEPRDSALLALALAMCQKPSSAGAEQRT